MHGCIAKAAFLDGSNIVSRRGQGLGKIGGPSGPTTL